MLIKMMIKILVYSCNASLMVRDLKCSVHSEQKKLGVLLKNGNLRNLIYILGKAGLYTYQERLVGLVALLSQRSV